MAEISPNGKKNVVKGEFARHKQFVLLPQCFLQTFLQTGKKARVCLRKGLTNSNNFLVVTAFMKKALNHFLLFPQCFLAFLRQFPLLTSKYN